jgi:hypothetical protein
MELNPKVPVRVNQNEGQDKARRNVTLEFLPGQYRIRINTMPKSLFRHPDHLPE